MAFCRYCGTEIPEGSAFCANCGANVNTQYNAQEQNNAQFNNQYNAQNNTQGKNFADTINNLNNTPDTTAEFDHADIEANKVLSLFAYLGILFLIPLLAAKDSKYARFHSNQGIVLFLCSLAVNVLRVIPYAGAVLASVGSIIVFVLAIIGIVNAVTGKAKELPVIGQIKLLK